MSAGSEKNPRQKQKLPVDDLIPEILTALDRRPLGARSILVQASPGSGKTTRIPPALLEHSGECIVLEPRRVAAKYAARRVAEESGTKLGEETGYQFRFENMTSSKTRLRFLTEGMLMRRFLSDPELRSAHTVILDEFHERHLHGDIAIAYLRKLQLGTRPDLRLIVMSATLETEHLSRFLGDAPVLKIDAPIFPVEIETLPSPPAKRLEMLVSDSVRAALERGKDCGDILVFLPGMAEIRRCSEALEWIGERALVCPLHGELSREEQEKAIEPLARRKVILATNVAETSLTIPGVRTVIDSGFHRVASYSWWSGIPTLRTRPISRASAIQRAGRAGRTAPGRCIRLYTRGDFDGRAPFQVPEIQRADLTQTVLELKSIGIQPSELQWLEPPPEQALESAESLLFSLGALTERAGSLNPLGRELARIPAHPRIGRMLLAARDLGCLREGAALGALISEGELERTDALEDALRPLQGSARKLADQLEGMAGQTRGPRENRGGSTRDALARAVLRGFPDRVARRKSSGELLFSGGGSAEAPRGQDGTFFQSAEFFVLLDVREKQGLGQARASTQVACAVAIEPEWLFDLDPPLVQESEELVWDPSRKRVQVISSLRYGQLILSESRSDPGPTQVGGASRIFAKEGLGIDLTSWGARLSLADALSALQKLVESQDASHGESVEAWAARLELLRHVRGELPPLSVERLRECVEKVLSQEGTLTLGQAHSIRWKDALMACFEEEFPGLSRELERLAPTEFLFPNGRRARIHYKLGSDPWLESRLQDFFGVKTPPSVLGGKVQLTLHLLAPNQRAVQVTSDLPGFWQRVYPEIRKELSRRYPRHSWPEDPTKAEPVRK